MGWIASLRAAVKDHMVHLARADAIHTVRPNRSVVALPNGSLLLVAFVHLKKTAGTAIRQIFDRLNMWLLLPYCVPRTTAVHRALALRANVAASFLFHELHCFSYMPNVASMLNATRTQLATSTQSPISIIAFTSLRHPVDLMLSERE